jgi:ethanolamine utilization protein EutM
VNKNRNKAIALLEVDANVAAIVGLGAMVKAADVRLIHVERRLGGRLVTVVVDGSVSDVRAAVEAGAAAAEQVGSVKVCEVIANPHPEVQKFLYVDPLDDDE